MEPTARRTATTGSSQSSWLCVERSTKVIRVAEAEGIGADIVKDGVLCVARNSAHLGPLRESLDYENGWGARSGDFAILTGDESNERIRVSNAVGVLFTPHCARPVVRRYLEGFTSTMPGKLRKWLPMNS